MKKFYLPLLIGMFLPLVSFAATTTFTDIIEQIGDWINLLTPIVVALALLYFFWGLANFILKSGEEKEKGKDIMIYGIIALFVMVAVWGLVSLIGASFGIDPEQNPVVVPEVDID